MTDLFLHNLLSAPVLSFFLGVLAVRIKSDLRIPKVLYIGISIYLLYAIGIKGGAALATTTFEAIAIPALVTLALGLITPLVAFFIAFLLFKFSREDAAALAAHYGSVSAVTFMATLALLGTTGIAYEGYLPALLAILEIPAIAVALLLVRSTPTSGWLSALREIMSLKSVLLLFGGLVVGFFIGTDGMQKVAPFFIDPFYGILTFFLLELGVVAGARIGDLRQRGVSLLMFGLCVPLLNGILGIVAGNLSGLSVGGTTVLAVMASSASYIAATAAVRVSIPNANPGYYLTSALVITFPFNISIGIPLYLWLARVIHA